MSLDATVSVKAFWEGRGLDPDLAKELVTHPDLNQRLLEMEIALSYLPRGMRVLDVGCGNGFSTAIFATYASHVVGIDYAESMIARAQRDFGHLPNVEFQLQDVLNLDLSAASFDVVVSQRCLINLLSWEDQQQSIINIANILNRGGYFLMQEGTQQGRERLNQTREMFGLSRMPAVSYNLDFDEEKLWLFLRKHFDIVEVRRFGLYDLLSRVVHPLLVSPSEPQYDAKINEVAWHICAKMEGVDDLAREFSAFLRRPDRGGNRLSEEDSYG